MTKFIAKDQHGKEHDIEYRLVRDPSAYATEADGAGAAQHVYRLVNPSELLERIEAGKYRTLDGRLELTSSSFA